MGEVLERQARLEASVQRLEASMGDVHAQLASLVYFLDANRPVAWAPTRGGPTPNKTPTRGGGVELQQRV